MRELSRAQSDSRMLVGRRFSLHIRTHYREPAAKIFCRLNRTSSEASVWMARTSMLALRNGRTHCGSYFRPCGCALWYSATRASYISSRWS